MGLIELATRSCPDHRCKAEVADVLIVGKTGSHKELVIDPRPTTWEDGGRVRLRDFQPGTAKHPLATRCTHAGQGFGVLLYRPHSESCGGGTGRTATRRRGEHA